ncbi:MAG: hypothetical protein HYZ42_12790 [Bacteroidetes bacterium]|nr:hypothetical protein [Bacteroidota bacterium]
MSICSLAIYTSISAQTDTLEAGTVEIRRTFKPDVKKGDKFYSTPLPETAYIAPPVIKFDKVDASKPLPLTPNLTPVKALSLSNPKLPKLYGNFFKLGIGNYAAPFAEVSLMNLRSKTIAAGVNMHHYSNNGNSLSRNWSENNIDGYMKKYFDDYVWSVNSSFNRDARKFYSYEKSLKDSIDSKLLNIHTSIFDLGTSIENIVKTTPKDTTPIKYTVGMKYYFLNNQYNYKEQNFNIYGKASQLVRGNLARLYTEFDANNFEGLQPLKRIFFKVNPTYTIKFDKLETEFGLRAVYLFTDNGILGSNRYYFYPDLRARYNFGKLNSVATIGINGDNIKSTYRSLFSDNPFLSKNLFLSNTIQNKLYYGISSQINNSWNVDLKGFLYYKTVLPIYYMTYQNNYKTDSLSSFSLVYATMNYQQYQVSVSYRQLDKLNFMFTGNVYKYQFKMDSIGLPYPNADLTMHINYNLDQKIFFKLDIYGVTKRTIGFADVNYTHFKPVETYKGYVDLNFAIDYKYSKHVSAFLTFRNLTNKAYSRWYNYPVNGINFLTGITITL